MESVRHAVALAFGLLATLLCAGYVLDRIPLSEAQPAGTSPAVGTVIAWWTSDPLALVPAGYAVCDGSVLQDPLSPLDGITLPNLQQSFIRGSLVADAGTSGPNSAHGHGVPDHAHTVGLSSGGAHIHSWATYSTTSNNWTFPSGPSTTWNNGIDNIGVGDFPIMREDSDASLTCATEIAGSHDHGAPTSTTNSVSGSATLESHEPPYLDLLFIMKVR